jgi:hypothetical protein
MQPLLALTLVLIASAAEARDREETCTAYTTMGGTTHETCRQPGRKERECTSYTTITGTTHTECR